ncbi:MAG: hypothetical protein JWN68_1234 [Nocardioides sp.]|jgi:hypothetical protein|uniref:hypothetical protein n=1 Tax=Nocardioides sp. TaxID=35761 RepID=UPI002604087A|nr:hypothetical protein [Nocardioides sp.]MCW2833281.1 hypothetical protein [Nocardioides sp.]
MRLPVPGPSDLISVLGKGAGQLDLLLGTVPRMIALLDRAEILMTRATIAIDGVERVSSRASAAIDEVQVMSARASAAIDDVEVVSERASGVVARTGGIVDAAEAQVGRLTPLLDGLEPSLTKLQPTLDVLADTTHPDEVAALVRLVDHLPELAARVENDVLPVMTTLGSVAPDLHDLLAVSRELNDMLAKLPGVGRIKRRIDEQQGEDGTTATVKDG